MLREGEKFSYWSRYNSSTKPSFQSAGEGQRYGKRHRGSRTGGNDRDRVSEISKRLFFIAANLRGTNKTGRLLVDSGSSLNLIKEMLVHLENLREKFTKVFSMGNDKHTTTEITKLKFQGKQHVFAIMPNDFSLPKDGMIGIPFMQSYKFNFSNTYLELDGVKHKCKKEIEEEHSMEVERKQTHAMILDHPNIPDSIYRIHNYQLQVPISNETDETLILSSTEIQAKSYRYSTET